MVQAGDRVAEPDRQAGGEAGSDLQDRRFAAGAGQAAGGQGAGGGPPADVRQRLPAERAGQAVMNGVVKSARVSQ